MKTIAYFDCPSGISGDMCLGAVLDAGVPLSYLRRYLSLLGLDREFTLTARETIKQGQRAMQAQVTLAVQPDADPQSLPMQAGAAHGHSLPTGHSHRSPEPPAPSAVDHTHGPSHPGESGKEEAADRKVRPHGSARNLPTIEQLIAEAALPRRVIDWCLAIFRRLGEAEAAVHGIPIDQVHFHEVGATDAIVDIVGTCLGLDYLSVDALVCSALPTGKGQVSTAHGWLPVPAPAVLKLMEMGEVPLYSNGIAGELVTPTGAAIVTALARGFGDPPAMTLQKVGLGAGQKSLPIANILRLWIGQETTRSPGRWPSSQGSKASAGVADENGVHLRNRPPTHAAEVSPVPSGQDTVVVLETQVDDLIPQAVGQLYDQLFQVGALDVFTQPVAMKKCRPGLLITVLCHPHHQDDCETVLFRETTTLGIRHRQQLRTMLQRRFETVETAYGLVSIKLAYHPHSGELMNAQPEYEDCLKRAHSHQVSWQEVYQTALAAWKLEKPASF